MIAEVEAVDPDGVVELPGRGPQEARLPGAGWSEAADDVAGLEGEVQVLGDDMASGLRPDPEAIHDQRGMAGGTMGVQRVGEGEEHGGEGGGWWIVGGG